MKLAVALLLNAGLLAVLLPWLRRQWHESSGAWRVALVVALGARLGLGTLRSIHPTYDAEQFDNLGQLLAAQLWADPAGGWQSLTGDVVRFAGQEFVFYGMSNTFFIGKLLAILNLASCSLPWLDGLYLSLLSFVGCWQLARVLVRVLPATPAGAGLVGLVLWPSATYWAVGLSKEAVLLGTGTWLTALVVEKFYGPLSARKWWRTVGGWLGIAVLAVVHFQMRYFFAVPLLGGLLGVALVQVLRRRGWGGSRWVQVVVLGVVLGAGAWLAPQISVAFRLNKLTSQLVRIYNHDLGMSMGRPHFEYPDLRPTPESLLRYAPQAIFNTLTQPWLGELPEPLYLLGGLENALLLVLLAGALVALGRGRGGRLPFTLGLMLVSYCLILALLMGLSTPNLGSLSRYRSMLLPFWVLLLLQNDYAAAVLRRCGLGPSVAATDENSRRP